MTKNLMIVNQIGNIGKTSVALRVEEPKNIKGSNAAREKLVSIGAKCLNIFKDDTSLNRFFDQNLGFIEKKL